MHHNRPRRTRSTLGPSITPTTGLTFTLNSRYRHNLVPRRSSSVSTPTSQEENFQHNPSRFNLDYDFSFDQQVAAVLARKCEEERNAQASQISPKVADLRKKKDAILKPTPVNPGENKNAVLQPTPVQPGAVSSHPPGASSTSLLGLLGSAKDSDPFARTSMEAMNTMTELQKVFAQQNLQPSTYTSNPSLSIFDPFASSKSDDLDDGVSQNNTESLVKIPDVSVNGLDVVTEKPQTPPHSRESVEQVITVDVVRGQAGSEDRGLQEMEAVEEPPPISLGELLKQHATPISNSQPHTSLSESSKPNKPPQRQNTINTKIENTLHNLPDFHLDSNNLQYSTYEHTAVKALQSSAGNSHASSYVDVDHELILDELEAQPTPKAMPRIRVPVHPPPLPPRDFDTEDTADDTKWTDGMTDDHKSIAVSLHSVGYKKELITAAFVVATSLQDKSGAVAEVAANAKRKETNKTIFQKMFRNNKNEPDRQMPQPSSSSDSRTVDTFVIIDLVEILKDLTSTCTIDAAVSYLLLYKGKPIPCQIHAQLASMGFGSVSPQLLIDSLNKNKGSKDDTLQELVQQFLSS